MGLKTLMIFDRNYFVLQVSKYFRKRFNHALYEQSVLRLYVLFLYVSYPLMLHALWGRYPRPEPLPLRIGFSPAR